MKYSKYFGEQLKNKELPEFSKKSIQKMFNIVYIEAVAHGMGKTKHLLDKDNVPNYDFLQTELTSELKDITRGLPPQLLYHDLCKSE